MLISGPDLDAWSDCWGSAHTSLEEVGKHHHQEEKFVHIKMIF